MSNKLHIRVYNSPNEVPLQSQLRRALKGYDWPENHVFVHVTPPGALDIPSDPSEYHVGEEMDEAVRIPRNGELYWYDTKHSRVMQAYPVVQGIKGINRQTYTQPTGEIKWSESPCQMYVVDLESTNLPIGAFIQKDEDFTEIIDMDEVTPEELSEAAQEAGLSNVGFVAPPAPKKPPLDFKALIDSLPE